MCVTLKSATTQYLLVSELLAELSTDKQTHTKTEKSTVAERSEHKELTFLNGQKAPSLGEEETEKGCGVFPT